MALRQPSASTLAGNFNAMYITAEVPRSMHTSSNSNNPSYLVPCVFKAVRMIDALREARRGLRVEEFRVMTGYARSTIYRILRTLIACEYLTRGSGGFYRLNHAVVAPMDPAARTREGRREFDRSLPGNDQYLEFERWGIRFCGNGARMNAHHGTSQMATSQSGEVRTDGVCERGRT
jgi:hypothetical protein